MFIKNTMFYYAKRIRPFFFLFLFIQLTLRIALFIREFANIDLSAMTVVKTFAYGLLFDLSAAAYYLIPFLLYMIFLSSDRHQNKRDRWTTRIFYYIYTYSLLFGMVSEWIFWDEFGSRFNFIAVDYLVYTREVIGNISESYPLPLLLSGIGVVAGAVLVFSNRFLLPVKVPRLMRTDFITARIVMFSLMLILLPAIYFGVDISYSDISENRFSDEIAKDGVYSLFSAFIQNELDYKTFYPTDTDADVLKRLRADLATDNSSFVNDKDILRYIKSSEPEKRYNVILVTMESMGSRFMNGPDGQPGLTPNMDRLAKESLFFSNLYSTGSRTVRGLEAITLSIPPSPGRSIVKRTGNENLFSLGFLFQERGYDTRFFYGGYGYFDNMNYFFQNNGFDIVDRTDFEDSEITFSNIWGVCDENLYSKVLQKADNAYAAKKPFMYLAMTTSNHRPYTYPEGKIDIPSHTGRNGGVKYADFALGKFIEDAASHPWFDNTIFVIVADHSTGWSKRALDVTAYHIPLMIYAPGILKPRDVKQLASQMDLAPTLLGLLDFSYYSRFYGTNLLSNNKPRAFIGNYQMLGYVAGDLLTILKPVKAKAVYPIGNKTAVSDLYLPDAIAYYQHGSNWKKHTRLTDSQKVRQRRP